MDHYHCYPMNITKDEKPSVPIFRYLKISIRVILLLVLLDIFHLYWYQGVILENVDEVSVDLTGSRGTIWRQSSSASDIVISSSLKLALQSYLHTVVVAGKQQTDSALCKLKSKDSEPIIDMFLERDGVILPPLTPVHVHSGSMKPTVSFTVQNYNKLRAIAFDSTGVSFAGKCEVPVELRFLSIVGIHQVITMEYTQTVTSNSEGSASVIQEYTLSTSGIGSSFVFLTDRIVTTKAADRMFFHENNEDEDLEKEETSSLSIISIDAPTITILKHPLRRCMKSFTRHQLSNQSAHRSFQLARNYLQKSTKTSAHLLISCHFHYK